MADSLPVFRYHPDPVATESVTRSDAVCRSCERARGYIYVGPVFAVEELEEEICPSCIADGSASARFAATFTDAESIGTLGCDVVVSTVVEELSKRTPGFGGWQQERWWTHCGDAAQFLGRARNRELRERWPSAVAALKQEANMDGEKWGSILPL